MNQHSSPKRTILELLSNARMFLRMADDHRAKGSVHAPIRWARQDLADAWRLIDAAPASTRRRWKSGR